MNNDKLWKEKKVLGEEEGVILKEEEESHT